MKRKKETSSLKATRRALIASAVCTLLCGLLLFSASVAWFSDTQESQVNELYAGNLDVELLYSRTMGEGSWHEVTNTTDDIFKVNVADQDELQPMRWEPGAINVVYFKVENKGALNAKYDFSVEIAEEQAGTNTAGAKFLLSQHIYAGTASVTDLTPFSTGEAALKAVTGKTDNITNWADLLSAWLKKLAGAETPETLETLETQAKPTLYNLHRYGTPLYYGSLPGVTGENTPKEDVFALVLYMPNTETNNEETNYKTGSTQPKISLKVKLVATQTTGEHDSFTDQYDIDATLPKTIPVILTSDQTAEAITDSIAGVIGAPTTKPGDVIQLPSGMESITLPTEITKNVVIRGTETTSGNTPQKTHITIQEETTVTDGATFEKLSFSDPNTGYSFAKAGAGKQEPIQFVHCDFGGMYVVQSDTVFRNCTFTNTNESDYAVKVQNGARVEFIGCTFNGSTNNVVLNAGSLTGNSVVTFANCTFNQPLQLMALFAARFNGVNGIHEPAVVLDASEPNASGYGYGVIFKDCAVEGPVNNNYTNQELSESLFGVTGADETMETEIPAIVVVDDEQVYPVPEEPAE